MRKIYLFIGVSGHYGKILRKGDTFFIFIYEKSRYDDLTQGLPKVELLSEVRSIISASMNLKKRFQKEHIIRILGGLFKLV